MQTRSILLTDVWLDNDRRLVRTLLALWLVPVTFFMWVDFSLYAGESTLLQLRLLTRLAAVAVPLVGIAIVHRVSSRAAYSRTVLAVSAAVASLLILLNLQRPPGPLPIRTPLIFLILLYGAVHNTPFRQIVVPVSYTTALAVQRLFWHGDPWSDASDLLVLAFVNAAGITMVTRRAQLEAALELAWGQRLPAVHGAAADSLGSTVRRPIVRICSYCRKVHNDPGGWQAIEHYLRDTTSVDFSHGICPDCKGAHFPEFSGK